MDESRLAALGYDPIRPQLQRIDALTTTSEFARESGYLSATDIGGPFNGTLALDSADSTAIVVNLSQSGILLPGREYYLSQEPRYVDVREKYVGYLNQIFSLTAATNPEGDARWRDRAGDRTGQGAVVTGRQPGSDARSRIASRSTSCSASYGIRLAAWAKPQGIERARYVMLAQPSFFRRFAELVATHAARHLESVDRRPLHHRGGAVSQHAFESARFDFFGLELSGQEKPRLRWRRGVSLVSGYLGDAVGRLYVKKHFPATARARVQRITDNVVAAFQ